MSVDLIEADAVAAFTIERAQLQAMGIYALDYPESQSAFTLGFVAGARWALNQIVKREMEGRQ